LIVLVVVVVLALPVLFHWYLWKRLVKDVTVRAGRGRRIGTWSVVGLGAVLILGFVGSRAAPLAVERWVAWPAYVWLALMFYLLVTLLVLEVPRLVLRLTWARRGAGAPTAAPAVVGTTRRVLLARGLAGVAGVTSVATVGYGMTQALGAPRLDRVRIPLAKLPRRMDGFRIALVSDIHLGPLRGRAHTRRIVDMINELNPDLITVVGDLVDGSVADLGRAAEPLRGLRSRHGSFFVTGNHEYFSGYAPWIAEVGELGLRVLQNERVEIDGLDLAGVNDVTGGSYHHGPDYGRALGDRDTTRPVVLMAHQPVQAFAAADHGVDLQLSGHTHGGQIQPFGAIVRLQQPIVSGYGVIHGTKVYVTNGAGFWGPPVRVGAPPQLSVVELRTA
jgi:predicted MPP superfamily phosphohydrolase